MKKFSKINESKLDKLDTIKDILLEIDLIDGVEKYYYGKVDSTVFRKSEDIEVNIHFKQVPKVGQRFVIDSKKIEILNEVFSIIQRLNDIGYKTYITYLATNSEQMVFIIEI